MSAIDWDSLHIQAKEIMTKAYAPYSKFPVGVAALVNDCLLYTSDAADE